MTRRPIHSSIVPRKELSSGLDGSDKRAMSDAHKAALALGRDEGRAVRRYLEALETHRPRPGRKRTIESVHRQLDETTIALGHSTALERLHLMQRRIDLETELSRMQQHGDEDIVELEAEFIKAASGYSQRKHISYHAWREVGVSARVLRAAGISRTRP